LLGDLVDIKHGFAFKGEFFRDELPGDILLTRVIFQSGADSRPTNSSIITALCQMNMFFMRVVTELSQAFALSVPHEEALRIRDDVAFFQAVRSVVAKHAPGDARPGESANT